jgi:hypothetical protein
VLSHMIRIENDEESGTTVRYRNEEKIERKERIKIGKDKRNHDMHSVFRPSAEMTDLDSE